MSVIFGLCRTDGRPVDPDDMRRMREALSHWAPDASGLWLRDSVGLGHLAHWTTPESVGESAPLVDAERDLVLTAGARLDNREELIDVLGAGPGAPSDSTLVLAAYRRWGVDCLAHLYGDFAFALWDGRERRLLLARDHVGVRPLYYHQGAGFIAFASEIKALRALAGVGHEPDEEWLAGALALTLPDGSRTFYRDVTRLPPGHRLVVSFDRGIEISRYWDLDVTRETRLGSDAEYAGAFRELLERAIRTRVRSTGGVGSEMSGGLDSTSIACLAHRMLSKRGSRVVAFASVLPEGHRAENEIDTRELVAGLCRQLDIEDPVFLSGEETGIRSALQLAARIEDEPLKILLPVFGVELYQAAQRRGVGVLLSGIGGDEMVSSQAGGFHEEMLASGQWRRLWTALATEPGGRRRAAASAARVAWRAVAGPKRDGWRDQRRRFAILAIEPAFARRHDVWRRYARRGDHLLRGGVRHRQRARVLEGGVQSHLEYCAPLATHHRVEPRYPLLDVRLLEFYLGLPLDQKVRGGIKRFLFRRSLDGQVPAEALWVDRKHGFSAVPSMPAQIRRDGDALLGDLERLPRDHPVRRYVRVDRVAEEFRRSLRTDAVPLTPRVWATLLLAAKLEATSSG